MTRYLFREQITLLLSGYPVVFNTLMDEFEGHINGVYFWAYYRDENLVCFYGKTFKCRVCGRIEDLQAIIKSNFE